MKLLWQLCFGGLVARIVFALFAHFRGDYDTGRIPAVALTQVAGILAVGLLGAERKAIAALAAAPFCILLATTAHVSSMPGMILSDSLVAQASELALPLLAVVAVSSRKHAAGH